MPAPEACRGEVRPVCLLAVDGGAGGVESERRAARSAPSGRGTGGRKEWLRKEHGKSWRGVPGRGAGETRAVIDTGAGAGWRGNNVATHLRCENAWSTIDAGYMHIDIRRPRADRYTHARTERRDETVASSWYGMVWYGIERIQQLICTTTSFSPWASPPRKGNPSQSMRSKRVGIEQPKRKRRGREAKKRKRGGEREKQGKGREVIKSC
jgi:hypothetical protein